MAGGKEPMVSAVDMANVVPFDQLPFGMAGASSRDMAGPSIGAVATHYRIGHRR